MRAVVQEVLRIEPANLSAGLKYFYDAVGAELFEEISRLPEYYQTRAELSIVCASQVDDRIQALGSPGLKTIDYYVSLL